MTELQRMVPKLDGVELRITAIVGDRYREDYVEGFSTARIFNSSLKLNFLGGSPQVIKPAMPFTCFVRHNECLITRAVGNLRESFSSFLSVGRVFSRRINSARGTF